MNTLLLKNWEQANKRLLLPPTLAWPTVFLFLGVLGLFIGSTYLTMMQIIPLGAGIVLNWIAQYASFTIIHDASHRAISQNAKVNDGLGVLASLILSPFAGFRAFRFIHMQHHRFTNEGELLDPDEYCGRGIFWLRPLRWMTLDIHYLFWYAKKWSSRPNKEKYELVITTCLLLTVLAFLTMAHLGYWVLLLYIITGRLATGALAMAFDFLPHYPYDTKGSEDQLKATNLKPGAPWIMTPLLLSQNYHLIHHLYPLVPFYRYPVIWQHAKGELIASGARIMDWRGREINYNETINNQEHTL